MSTQGQSNNSGKIKKLLKVAVATGAVGMVAIQFVPVEGLGDNPVGTFDPKAPPEVEAILRKACYDCHSNETQYPWYARLAPGSWLMARDVRLGRENMNISEWGEMGIEAQAYDMETSWERIESGEMPPWFYIFPMHPDAQLTDAEKQTLKAWLMNPPEEQEESDEAATGGNGAGGHGAGGETAAVKGAGGSGGEAAPDEN